jgi:hypothetical protein
MARFRKRPVVIEAFRVAASNENVQPMPLWAVRALGDGGVMLSNDDGTYTIHTLEGDHLASRGDWIIQGIKGELYPCKPEIFEATYEAVE